MKPKDVNKNKDEVWNTQFGHRYAELPISGYKVSDTVRISKYKSTFTKELFKMSRVI